MKYGCKVKGQLADNTMCKEIFVGNVRCGFNGKCEHQHVIHDTPEWEPDSIEREEGGGAIWRLQNGGWD